MGIEDLIKRIKLAEAAFLSRHNYLLEVAANERSITHKFAECLAEFFDGWDVDCEYNRDGYLPKRVGLDEDESVSIGDDQGKTVFPDIIVHHRKGTGVENNLLILEAKKDSSQNSRRKDVEKIERIKQEYDYQFGIFLNFTTGEKPQVEYLFV